VDVQGELGSVPYLGEAQMGDIDWDKYMTDPVQAKVFVEETGIDALAVAIGNAHGFLKERAQPDFDRMAMINKNCALPFVLHGASDWENGKVVEAIKNGVSCFNVDTAIRIAFVNNLINSVSGQGELGFDLRKLLGGAQDAVKETVKYKMKIFGSDGKV
jgi:fructose-bisphosphate aldolase class II